MNNSAKINLCRICLLPLILVTLFIFTGCEKTLDYEIRVHVSAGRTSMGEQTSTVVMPISDIKYTIYNEALLTEASIVNIELVKVKLGKALFFQFDLLGSRALFRTTTTSKGQSLVLLINGKPAGARKMGYTIQNGQLIMFVEVTDAKLDELVLGLRETIRRVHKMK